MSAGELSEICTKLKAAKQALIALEGKVEQAGDIGAVKGQKELAFFFKEEVHTSMDELREQVDALEMLVAKEVWPIPSYGDLIFEV